MDVDDEARRFVESVSPERRLDAETVLGLMERATEQIVASSCRTLTSGTYGQRAREGRES